MLDQFLDALAPILVNFLAALMSLLAVYVIRWVRAKTAEAVENASPNVRWLLEEGALMAVRAAEQLGLKDESFDKYEYAFEVVQKYLAEKGVEADVMLIKAAIEAAVLQEFNKPDPEVF